jgi:hypothetical protein
VSGADLVSDAACIITPEELARRIQNATPEMFRQAAAKFRLLNKKVDRETVEARWRGTDIVGGRGCDHERKAILKALECAPKLACVDPELADEAQLRRSLARIDHARVAVTNIQLKRAPKPMVRERAFETDSPDLVLNPEPDHHQGGLA